MAENNGYTPRIVTPPSNEPPAPSSQQPGQINQVNTSAYQTPPTQSEVPIPAYPNYPSNNQQTYNAYNYGGAYSYEQPQVQPNTDMVAQVKTKLPLSKKISNFLMKKWWLVLLGILLVAVISVAVYVFRPATPDTTNTYENVEATIVAPEVANSGTSAIWSIRIQNNESVSIQNVEVDLEFDRTFKFGKVLNNNKPKNLEGTKYELGTLSAVNSGTSESVIQIEGTLVGNVGEDALMKGVVKYTPQPFVSKAGNNSKTRAIEASRTTIKEAKLKLVMTPSEQSVQNGNEVTMNLAFENLSDQPIKDARIKLTYPDKGGFEYTDSELQLSNTSTVQKQPSNGNDTWDIPSLPRLQKQNLKVTGIVQGADGIKLNFEAEILNKNPQGEYETLTTQNRSITVTSQPLIVTTSINGKTPTSTFEPGETLTFDVDYQNRSSRTLKNVEITAQINDPADILDYKTLAYVGGKTGDINNRTITWLANGVPQLETFPPQSTGKLSFTVQVKKDKDFVKTDLTQDKYTLQPTVEAKAISQQPVQFAGETYKAAGELSFKQDIEEIKSGDANTNIRKFKVTWTLGARQNQVNDVAVATRSTFPPSIWKQASVQPSANAGEISFDPNNGRISWNPGVITNYAGYSNSARVISFEMEINSQSASQNKNLFEEVDITGVDDNTGQSYKLKGAPGKIK
jgi:hypothetical protein